MNPSNIDPKSISLWEMKNKIKSREHFYALLSRIYRLPALSSKALSVDYMKQYLKEPCSIFRIKRSDFNPPYIPVKHVLAREMFEATGVYFFLTPTDDEKLFPKSIKIEHQIEVKMDPEY